MEQLDPYRFIRVAQFFGRFTLTWPLHQRARTGLLIGNYLMWTVNVLTHILCFGFVVATIIQRENDPVALSQLISVIAILVDSCFQLVLLRIKWTPVQVLMHEIMSFLKTANRTEKQVCREYIVRYTSYHLLLYGTYYAALGSFLFSPLTMGKQFPFDIWYPFSLEPLFNQGVVYFFQYYAMLQTVTLLTGDRMVFTLLWYATVKLKLLSLNFSKIDDASQLRDCARSHQDIIRYVGETGCVIRCLVLKNLLTVSATIICAGVQLSYHRSLTVLSQFFFVICISTVRLFGFAWAADDLTDVVSFILAAVFCASVTQFFFKSARITSSIYHSPAFDKSYYLSKSLMIVIQRSQRNLIITMWGTSLGLSLNFFTTYVLRLMSFVMTLKAVVDRYV